MTPAWPLRSVASLAKYVNGYPFKPDDHEADGLPVIRIKQLNDPDAETDFFSGRVPERNLLRNGDLVFSWSGSLCVKEWNRGPAWLNQHLFRVIPLSGVDKGWLRWALEVALVEFESHMHGSAMTHITKPMMREVRLPLPPLDVQRRIADFLDDQVGRVDGVVEWRQEQARLLEERSESLLLDQLGFPSMQPQEIGIQYGNVSLAAGIASVSAPDEWRRVRFKSVVHRSLKARGSRDIPLLSLASAGFLRPRSEDQQPPARESLPRYLVVEPNDLVINPMWLTGGGIAVSGSFGAVSPDYRVFQVGPMAEPRFLHHLLRCRPYRDQYLLYTRANTTFDRRVAQVDIDSLPLSLPPLELQRQIAVECDRSDSRYRSTTSSLETQIGLLQERKRSLITAAVTGEFDVATSSSRASEVALSGLGGVG